MAEYRNWLLTEEAHIVTLTLSRPHVMNSLTAETLFELRDITAHLRTRRNVWVVIVQGQGDHFSTGMDVGEIKGKLGQSEQANREHLLSLQLCLDEFEELEKPTIAKLHGFCRYVHMMKRHRRRLDPGLVLRLSHCKSAHDFQLARSQTWYPGSHGDTAPNPRGRSGGSEGDDSAGRALQC